MKSIAIFFLNLHVGAPVRSCEDPSPSTTSRHSCLCLAWVRLLDVCGGRIFSDPTTISRGDVWAAAGLVDQGQGRFFLFIIVVDNSKKSVMLWCSASRGRALASKRPWAAIASAAPVWDDPMAIGHLPATLSSVVGAGRLSSSLLLVYR